MAMTLRVSSLGFSRRRGKHLPNAAVSYKASNVDRLLSFAPARTPLRKSKRALLKGIEPTTQKFGY
jgi:hypothetical protein